MTEENIEIGKIRRDGGTQPRAALDETTLAEYAEALAAGAEFPPVDVFHDGAEYWLADGFHRVVAHERAGRQVVLATVRQGDQRAAVLFSTGVNADHGLRRSNADKRRAVEVLLRDGEWGQWSDREIARQAKVSHPLVAAMRIELSGNSSRYGAGVTAPEMPTAAPIERTVSREGTTYPMNTAAIGSTPRPWASVDALAAGIATYMAATWPDDALRQRADLQQVTLFSPAGTALLDRLMRSSYLPRPARREDVLAAVRQLLAAGERPAARAVAWSPAAAEQGGGGAGEQGNEGAGRPRTEAEVAAEAQALEPRVWAWLGLAVEPTLPTNAAFEKAERLTGSLLDLAGFHAEQGRNYDWEALVGALGNGIDHAALRLAVAAARKRIVAVLQQLADEITPAAPPAAPPPAPEPPALTTVIHRWLAELAEGSEIPTDRNGEPEKDAVRLLANGGGAAWRQLRQHPAWPAEMRDEAKLTAVRVALAELTGTPVPQPVTSERRPPSWAGVRPVAGGTGTERPRLAAPPTGGLSAKITGRLQGHLACLVAYADRRDDPDPDLATMIEDVQGIIDLLTTA